MQDFPPVSHDTSPHENKTVGFLKRLVERRPVVAGLLLLLYFVLVAESFVLLYRPAVKSIHLSFLMSTFFGELVYALIVATPIFMLGWWSETGFTRGLSRRYIAICIIPLALVIVPALCVLPAIAGRASILMLVLGAVIVLTIGFTEEGLCRGLLLRILLPKGIWFAVILSSVLFASLHLLNLLDNYPLSFVVEQMIGALGLGMLLAALRLRSFSIWPAIALHAMRDFDGVIQLSINPRAVLVNPSIAVVIVNIIYSLLFVANAIFLLRPSRLPQLRVAYGLQPALAMQATEDEPMYKQIKSI